MYVFSDSQRGYEKSPCESHVGSAYNFTICSFHKDMDVEPNIGGKTPKWMVKIMENPIKIDDLGGTTIFGNTHIFEFLHYPT